MITPGEDPVFSTTHNLLSWTSKRQQALASNVANLDTPGYQAKDYTFESEMRSLALAKTSEKHIGLAKEDSSARLIEVGTREKPNGNNVDIERELTEISKNGLEYVTVVQYLTQKIRTLRSAINEGGRT
jgi:flagellar basal-body rod protein FlgB